MYEMKIPSIKEFAERVSYTEFKFWLEFLEEKHKREDEEIKKAKDKKN